MLHQVDTAYAALIVGPRRLNNQERHALAGLLYKELDAIFATEPVDENYWQAVIDVLNDALSGSPWLPLTIGGSADERRRQKLEMYVGQFLDAILLRNGVVASAEDRQGLLAAFAKRKIEIAQKLKRNSEGD